MPQWSNNNNYDTPSLTAIVQEIVDQPGWSANNALVIVGRTEADRDRSADSRNGSTSNAPLLKVCYAQEYTLSYSAGAGGSLTGNTNQTVQHGQDGSAVTAVPDTGYDFVEWSDGSTDNPRTDTNVTANIDVTASFALNEYTLTVNTEGNGTVGIDPDEATHLHGDVVELTATADPGWTFAGWSGDLSGTDNPANLVMDANKTVTATFTAVAPVTCYALTLTHTPGRPGASANSAGCNRPVRGGREQPSGCPGERLDRRLTAQITMPVLPLPTA